MLVDIPRMPYLQPGNASTRSNHSLKFKHFHNGRDYFNFSFFSPENYPNLEFPASNNGRGSLLGILQGGAEEILVLIFFFLATPPHRLASPIPTPTSHPAVFMLSHSHRLLSLFFIFDSSAIPSAHIDQNMSIIVNNDG